MKYLSQLKRRECTVTMGVNMRQLKHVQRYDYCNKYLYSVHHCNYNCRKIPTGLAEHNLLHCVIHQCSTKFCKEEPSRKLWSYYKIMGPRAVVGIAYHHFPKH